MRFSDCKTRSFIAVTFLFSSMYALGMDFLLSPTKRVSDTVSELILLQEDHQLLGDYFGQYPIEDQGQTLNQFQSSWEQFVTAKMTLATPQFKQRHKLIVQDRLIEEIITIMQRRQVKIAQSAEKNQGLLTVECLREHVSWVKEFYSKEIIKITTRLILDSAFKLDLAFKSGLVRELKRQGRENFIPQEYQDLLNGPAIIDIMELTRDKEA